jgi:hypothetical protein
VNAPGYVDQVWVQEDPSSYTPDGGDPALDDIYIDTIPAVVFITTSPTLAARGERQMQVPYAWSDTSISVYANQGILADASVAYLYVCDANNVCNANGVSITLGETEPGSGWYNAVASAEICDPIANTCEYTGSLNQARMLGFYGMSQGMPTFVGGGTGPFGNDAAPNSLGLGTSTNTIEVYSVAGASWTQAATRIPVEGGRECDGGNTALTLNSGDLFWASGRTTFYGLALSTRSYSYNAATDVLTSTGIMNTARVNFGMFKMSDGSVIVASGRDATDTFTAVHAFYTTERWTPATNIWAYTSPLPVIKNVANWISGPTLGDGRALFSGGTDIDFNLSADTYVFGPSY